MYCTFGRGMCSVNPKFQVAELTYMTLHILTCICEGSYDEATTVYNPPVC